MSGHNKWSTIKHKKAKVDAARGKLFSKLIREITVAARLGGGDPDGNARLRSAILAARAGNMPVNTIERAIRRGTGEEEGESYEELTYEGYGPAGVAFIVEAMTTNRNRTVQEMRHAFQKYGGNMGSDGSVGWMFETKGYLEVPKDGVSYDALFEAAVEAGATDILDQDAHYAVYCALTDLATVNNALEKAGYAVTTSRPVREPTTTVPVTGDTAATVMRMMEHLDDLDDVQNVYTNADISEDEMARLSAE
jgi:YebC/PmpR family DNA-binding regulatory protein